MSGPPLPPQGPAGGGPPEQEQPAPPALQVPPLPTHLQMQQQMQMQQFLAQQYMMQQAAGQPHMNPAAMMMSPQMAQLAMMQFQQQMAMKMQVAQMQAQAQAQMQVHRQQLDQKKLEERRRKEEMEEARRARQRELREKKEREKVLAEQQRLKLELQKRQEQQILQEQIAHHHQMLMNFAANQRLPQNMLQHLTAQQTPPGVPFVPHQPPFEVNSSRQVVLSKAYHEYLKKQAVPDDGAATSSAQQPGPSSSSAPGTPIKTPSTPISKAHAQLIVTLRMQHATIGEQLKQRDNLIERNKAEGKCPNVAHCTNFPGYDFVNRSLFGCITIDKMDMETLEPWREAQETEMKKLRLELAELCRTLTNQPVLSIQTPEGAPMHKTRGKLSKEPVLIRTERLDSNPTPVQPSTPMQTFDPRVLLMSMFSVPSTSTAFSQPVMTPTVIQPTPIESHSQPEAITALTEEQIQMMVLGMAKPSTSEPARSTSSSSTQTHSHIECQHSTCSTSTHIEHQCSAVEPESKESTSSDHVAHHKKPASPILGSSDHPIDLDDEEERRIQRAHLAHPILANMLTSTTPSTSQTLAEPTPIVQKPPTTSVILQTARGPVACPSDVSPEQKRQLLAYATNRLNEWHRERIASKASTSTHAPLKSTPSGDPKPESKLIGLVEQITMRKKQEEQKQRMEQERQRQLEIASRPRWVTFSHPESSKIVNPEPTSETHSDGVPINLVLGESTIPEPSSLVNSASNSNSASPKRSRKRKPEKRISMEEMMEMEMEEETLQVEQDLEPVEEVVEEVVEVNDAVKDEVPVKRTRLESSDSVSCTPFGTSIHQNQVETAPAQQVSPVGIQKEEDGTHFQENRRNGTRHPCNSLTFGASMIPEHIEEEPISDVVETSEVVTSVAKSSEQPEREISTLRDETFKAAKSIEEDDFDEIPDSFPFMNMEVEDAHEGFLENSNARQAIRFVEEDLEEEGAARIVSGSSESVDILAEAAKMLDDDDEGDSYDAPQSSRALEDSQDALQLQSAQQNVVQEAYHFEYDSQEVEAQESVQHERENVGEASQYEPEVVESSQHVRVRNSFEALGDVDISEERADEVDPSIDEAEPQEEQAGPSNRAPNGSNSPSPRRHISLERINAFLDEFAPPPPPAPAASGAARQGDVARRQMHEPQPDPAALQQLQQNAPKLYVHFMDLLDWVIDLIANPRNSSERAYRNAESFIVMLNAMDHKHLSEEDVDKMFKNLLETFAVVVEEDRAAANPQAN